jgi:hypothetical protein
MQAARTSRKLKAEPQGTPPAMAGSERTFELSPAEMHTARQAYLDGLPIAVALIEMAAGEPVVSLSNALFNVLAGGGTGPGSDLAPTLHHFDLHGRIRQFLGGDDEAIAFRWCEGETVGARHFLIRLSRLDSVTQGTPRCLLSIIDRTAEVETERSLRAEMLHDSLTGLPNRVAFSEAVENAIYADTTGHCTFAIPCTR